MCVEWRSIDWIWLGETEKRRTKLLIWNAPKLSVLFFLFSVSDLAEIRVLSNSVCVWPHLSLHTPCECELFLSDTIAEHFGSVTGLPAIARRHFSRSAHLGELRSRWLTAIPYALRNEKWCSPMQRPLLNERTRDSSLCGAVRCACTMYVFNVWWPDAMNTPANARWFRVFI